MIGKRKISICFIVIIMACCGCARTYYITRWDGTKIAIESYKWGDQEYYYNVDFNENGTIKSESYGFVRKISPILSEIGNMAKAALSGAKEAL